MNTEDSPGDKRDEMERFLNAFAANLWFLADSRKALLSHPLSGRNYGSLEAAVCRLTAIVIVDAIEDGLLKLWEDEDFLDGYFKGKSKHDPKERVESLVGRFHKTGVEADPSVIGDFLALRYLRNAFSHARLKSHEREYLEQAGLQAQVDAPDKRLLDRAARVGAEMAGYISRASLASTGTLEERHVAGSDLLVALNSLRHTDDWLGHLITPDQLKRVWWCNFGALDWWLADNPAPEPGRVRTAMEIALKSWAEMRRDCDLLDEDVERSIETLEAFHEARLYPERPVGIELKGLEEELSNASARLPEAQQNVRLEMERAKKSGWVPRGQIWDSEVPDGVAEAVLRATVPAFGERGPRDLLTALRAGAKAYERHRSVAAPSVLWRLWKLGENGSASLKEACAGSIRLFRLSGFWSGWVETGSPPALDTWAARERELRERTL